MTTRADVAYYYPAPYYITKPIDVPAFLALVDRLIGSPEDGQ